MNSMKTTLLLGAMTGLFLFVGYALAGENGMLVALAFAALSNLFYSRRSTVMGDSEARVWELLAAQERTLAVVDADMLATVEVTLNRHFRRIADVEYLNTALLRIGTFLKPDAARDLQHVILVGNH